MEIIGQWQLGTSEFHAVCLRRRYAFRLPYADILTLILRYKGQYLQNHIPIESLIDTITL